MLLRRIWTNCDFLQSTIDNIASNCLDEWMNSLKGLALALIFQVGFFLQVLAGSYLCVGGAILGLMKPGRITLFGILLVIWGLIRILVLGKSGFSHANGVRIYPTIFIALVSAFFSIRKDVRKIIHTFNLKHVGKAKHF